MTTVYNRGVNRSEAASEKPQFSGSGGGTRTPDTRIMIPTVSEEYQSLGCKQAPETPHMNQIDGEGGVNENDPDERDIGTKWEWMHCPTGVGEMRYCKERFAAMLERTGVTTGTPPALPKYCVEEPEGDWNRLVGQGLYKWTYFARGKWTGRIKIGQSNNPWQRARDLIHSRYGEEAELLVVLRGSFFERAYHDAFRDWHEGHEWFAPHPDILAEIDRLNSLGPKRGCNLDPALSMNAKELRNAC